MKRKVIFVDRDGTIIVEPVEDMQVDSLEKLEFVPGAISALRSLAALDYDMVLASNQDGLGTASFPEETFWPAHGKMLKTLGGEGVTFADPAHRLLHARGQCPYAQAAHGYVRPLPDR